MFPNLKKILWLIFNMFTNLNTLSEENYPSVLKDSFGRTITDLRISVPKEVVCLPSLSEVIVQILPS